jgi:hypothetical protein
MKNPRSGTKFVFRRILVALALALSVGSPATSLRAAADKSCESRTDCAPLPVKCFDKEGTTQVPCPENAETNSEKFDEGWQTGFAHAD